MSVPNFYDSLKKATVAIVARFPNKLPARPFTILGSGFCVHPTGVVITCAHVFNAFLSQKSRQTIMIPGQLYPQEMTVPYAMFKGDVAGGQIEMHPVQVITAVPMKTFDLAAMKLSSHPAFPQGYPTLPIADYSEIHEMLEVGTCGFPLGEYLHDQFGTVTSSFTKGMISSIIPASGVTRENVRGFQLDLTATNGNSGGPVFSLATGAVFGVLQSGVVHPQSGQIVQGLTRAEPVYPLYDEGLIDRLVRLVQEPRRPGSSGMQ
jgi:trypsin-like peptidase